MGNRQFFIQEDKEALDRKTLLGEDIEDDPYSIANISKAYIENKGQLTEVKRDLQREKNRLLLNKMRKMQRANDQRLENKLFGLGMSNIYSTLTSSDRSRFTTSYGFFRKKCEMTHHSPTLDVIIIAEQSGLVNLQTVHFPIFDRFLGSLKSNKSEDAL